MQQQIEKKSCTLEMLEMMDVNGSESANSAQRSTVKLVIYYLQERKD